MGQPEWVAGKAVIRRVAIGRHLCPGGEPVAKPSPRVMSTGVSVLSHALVNSSYPGARAAEYQQVVAPRVSVVIPALNEALNVPDVFGRLPQDIFEVIPVDGDSVDDTVAVARTLRPDVRVVRQSRRGRRRSVTQRRSRGTLIDLAHNDVPRIAETAIR